VERHEKQCFVVAFTIDRASECMNRKLRNAIALTDLGNSIKRQFVCELRIDVTNTHRLSPTGVD